MNKSNIRKVGAALRRLSKSNLSNKKFSYSYHSRFLDYQSYLNDFSLTEFKLFDELFNELNINESINNLFEGKKINHTEDRPALHHFYRSRSPKKDFNFLKICKPFLANINKKNYKNIITFGIGGSYEGPKLLQEFTLNNSHKICNDLGSPCLCLRDILQCRSQKK